MRRDDNKKKILTSVEIVDVPPPAYNETEEDVSLSAGTTQLSKEELHHLFNNRNLAFVATLSRWFSAYNSGMDRDGRRFDLDKYF